MLKEALVLLFQIILDHVTDEDLLEESLQKIKVGWPMSNLSDLVFWSGDFFGDGNQQRVMSAEKLANGLANEIINSLSNHTILL